ncbi:MAG: methyltransferase [Daejeonella sp.]
MPDIFQFKQFFVNQTGCAMKVNTDAVLLGALAENEHPENVLDIGTGTGLIALMLAQRFSNSIIDAVEINQEAVKTAAENFKNSPFSERLNLYPLSFENYFLQHPDKKYDLIISNPPFFINSLRSSTQAKETARHTDKGFFKRLINNSANHLTEQGQLVLILPLETNALVSDLSSKLNLFIQKQTLIHSFPNSEPHRTIITFGFSPSKPNISKFVIYEKPKVYTREYRTLLKDFLTIF